MARSGVSDAGYRKINHFAELYPLGGTFIDFRRASDNATHERRIAFPGAESIEKFLRKKGDRDYDRPAFIKK